MRLSRYKALTVRKPLKRKSSVKNQNRRRKAKEFLRCYGSEERVAWIAEQPCCVCAPMARGYPRENVHVVGGGAGRKADAKFIVPMSHNLHKELHVIGVESFEAKYSVDLLALAERTEQNWQRHINRSETP